MNRTTFLSILTLCSYYTSFLEGPGSFPRISASAALLTLEELCQLTLTEDISIYYLDKEIHLQV